MSVHLRLATLDDAAAVAAIYEPYVCGTVISFETEPPDEAEMRRRLQTTLAQWPWLVAVDGDAVIGYAYAGEHRSRRAYRWSVDAAVYLDGAAHRRGIGRQLYRRLFALLLRQGYVNAYAGISLPNAASVGLHEALGFVQVGVYRHVGYKLGAWHDVGWWQRALQLPPVEAADPVPLPALADATVRALLAAE